MRRYRTLAIVLLVLAPAAANTLSAGGGEMKQATRFQQKGARALSNGDLPTAEKQFTKSLAAMPSFPAAHIGLGQIAMSRKDFEGALSHFEQARDGYAGLILCAIPIVALVGTAILHWTMQVFLQTNLWLRFLSLRPHATDDRVG